MTTLVQQDFLFPYPVYLPLNINFTPGCIPCVVNPEDLRREIELLLGVAAYSLLYFALITRRNYWRDGVIYNYCK